MTKCAAVGCKNSSNKPVKMNKFPKDFDRRNQWVKNCQTLGNMGNWIPSSTSHLCQFHFSPDMWEKERADGKMKLKHHAVPTIFGDSVPQVNVSLNFICESVCTSSVTDVESPAGERPNHDFIPIKITRVIVQPKLDLRISTGVINSSIDNQDCAVIIPATSKSFNDGEDSIQNLSENCESSQLNKTGEIPAVSSENEIDSININVLEAPEDDEELKQIAVEEQSLLNLQKDCTEIDKPTEDVSLEKFEKLQKMYAKSEKLRIRMKKTYKRKLLALQRNIRKLKQQVG